MASVLVKDLIQPAMYKRGLNPEPRMIVRYGQLAMTGTAVLLASVACLCYYWQQHTDMPLLQFALSVMVFSYSGLLGVYFTTLFTQRGSSTSISWALVIGFAVPLALQPYMLSLWQPEDKIWSIGFTWQLLIGASLATIVCMLGRTTSQLDATSTEHQQVT